MHPGITEVVLLTPARPHPVHHLARAQAGASSQDVELLGYTQLRRCCRLGGGVLAAPSRQSVPGPGRATACSSAAYPSAYSCGVTSWVTRRCRMKPGMTPNRDLATCSASAVASIMPA